jgi:hypothetical protein
MSGTERLFAGTALAIQALLTAYFALRAWSFETALQIGWVIYAVAIPALIVSLVLTRARAPWYQWIGGPLYAAWAAFGFYVDIANPVGWRSPILAPVFVPYVALYLAATMFYWWPLGRISRRLWFAGAVLFAVGTALNFASHGLSEFKT